MVMVLQVRLFPHDSKGMSSPSLNVHSENTNLNLRMRKEPSWDLSIAPAATNNSLGATPRKQRIPRTPKKSPAKKTPKKATARDNEMSDDDSDLGMETPSKRESPIKKEALNKVKGGRVEKKLSLPSRAAKSGKSYIESDDEDEDGESIVIKDEDVGAMDFGRAADGDEDLLGGGGFGNGNGHTNGESLSDDEDQFYDDES